MNTVLLKDISDFKGTILGNIEVPIIENIHSKLLDAISAPNARLDMSEWHTCATTHCRAGWIVRLAGEEGYELECALGPALAAKAVYNASGYNIAEHHFYDTDETAMAEIKRLAAAEQAGDLKELAR